MTTARRQEIEAIRTLVNLHDPDTQPDEWQPEDHAAAEAAAYALGPLLRRAARDTDARDAARARRATAEALARRHRKLSPPELIRAKREVRQRAGGRCEAMTPVCSCRHEHTHHRRLRSQGGGHDAANLLAVCRPCHDYIHAHPLESYVEGWMVRSKVDGPEVER